MERQFILAQQLLDFIRSTGMSKSEAHSALTYATLALMDVNDLAETPERESVSS